MAYTLKLDENWDLFLNSEGRIAMADSAYAVAQNVACAIRLFNNDAYYDTDLGVPHFEITLGKLPPSSVIRSRYKKAALSVDGVADADVEITSFDNRACSGNIYITLTNGEKATVSF